MPSILSPHYHDVNTMAVARGLKRSRSWKPRNEYFPHWIVVFRPSVTTFGNPVSLLVMATLRSTRLLHGNRRNYASVIRPY
ncbi:MAG: hypothetical protein JWM95_14 [Gemmatimonadetes bacterium]|nr:hypothetical protein [Gemmatimonadota bacterium]